MKQEKKENRRNYSIDPSRARELAQHSLDMSNAVGKTVTRQTILDTLVASLQDKTVYSKVLKAIKDDQK
ncbi:TPA: hypothetical protein DEB29_03590 [Candidatus Wolfebacteria bacterium]|nr:hypothetical protein [Candidatus Wolfebacteria bacterium]